MKTLTLGSAGAARRRESAGSRPGVTRSSPTASRKDVRSPQSVSEAQSLTASLISTGTASDCVALWQVPMMQGKVSTFP